jgi:hypothetical protein
LCIARHGIQARQVFDCVVNRQLHFIGIDLRGQPDVTVPHQFHGEPLRHSVALQKRRPGVAQRVEIPIPAQLIPVGNPIGFRVQGQTPGAWNAMRKDQISPRASGWPVSGQRLDNLRHQLHRFLFLVFGRIVSHHHERHIGVQVQIAPLHLLQFLLPQSCPGGSEIDYAPIFRPGHQLAQFLIREGPAHPLLFAPLIGPGHVL